MTEARILDSRIDGLNHEFKVGLDDDKVAAQVERRLRELSRSARMPGFRPGRVPLSLLRKRHGEGIRNSVVQQMAIEVARNVIAEHQLEPSRRPSICMDDAADQDAGMVTFTLLLQVAPGIEAGQIDGFRLQRLRVPDDAPALAEQAHAHLRRQLLDALLEGHDFPVAQELVDEEYARILEGFETQVGEAVDAELEAELARIALRRVRLAILLAEIGHRHGIEIAPAEVDALVESQAERHPEHTAEIIDYYLDHPSALAELKAPLFEERVIEFLLERCEIEDVELAPDELRQRLGKA